MTKKIPFTITLSSEGMQLLSELARRFSSENKLKISRNLIIERALHAIKDKNVFEVLGILGDESK